MDRLFITLAAVSGFLAVALGAFGAHALRDRLSADALQIFQTGVSYQMYHALALLAVGILLARFSTDGSPWLTGAGWLFAAAMSRFRTGVEAGVPESFKILVNELQSLGLKVTVLDEADKEIDLRDRDDDIDPHENPAKAAARREAKKMRLEPEKEMPF